MQLVIHYFLHGFEAPIISIIFINGRQVNWLYGNLPRHGHWVGDSAHLHYKPTPESWDVCVQWQSPWFSILEHRVCVTAVKAFSFGLWWKLAVTKFSLCALLPQTGLDHQLVSINEDTGQISKWHPSKIKPCSATWPQWPISSLKVVQSHYTVLAEPLGLSSWRAGWGWRDTRTTVSPWGHQILRHRMVFTRHHSGNCLHCSEQRKPLKLSHISCQLSPCIQHHSSKPAAAWTWKL